jgi:hypothetical protein
MDDETASILRGWLARSQSGQPPASKAKSR